MDLVGKVLIQVKAQYTLYNAQHERGKLSVHWKSTVKKISQKLFHNLVSAG